MKSEKYCRSTFNVHRSTFKALLILVLLNLQIVYTLPSLQGVAGGGSLWAQDVTISVTPHAPVLPPQAGEYMANPGKFFSVKLMNNSDEQQLVHIGMHVDMLSPDREVVMATPANGHIPREPIVLAPRQAKILNPVEMRNLFRHFTLDEIGLRPDIYQSDANGVVGLLPEGQYELFMQAYKWDPQLTQPVQLNHPEDGNCQFAICYKAQPPRFLTPVSPIMGDDDPLGQLAVVKLDVNNPVHLFTWTPPTLACNTSLVQFNYDVKVVKLDGLMPDEAIEKNASEYQQTKLLTPTFTLPQAYLSLWQKDTTVVYAMQVTAHSMIQHSSSSLNFSLLENGGRSDIKLFRFCDPTFNPNDSLKSGRGTLTAEDGGAETSKAKPYTFEQPTLIRPKFSTKVGRKVFVGDSIVVDWRKAWLHDGRGTRQDTISFEYTVALYKGNPADSMKNIFLSKPVYSNKVDEKARELSDTIKWSKLRGRVQAGDYLVLRVTAKNTNGKEVVAMLGDSLNYVDFAMAEHFKETFACGTSTADVSNKQPIDHLPAKGARLQMSDWTLTLGDDVEQDEKSRGLKGTGWVNWNIGSMGVRVAVKFDNIMVNSDLVVYDGVLNTYPKEDGKGLSIQQAVDTLFSAWGLDNIWGDLALPDDVAAKVSTTANGGAADIAKQYDLGKYYSYFKNAGNQWDNKQGGNLLDLYLPVQLPDTIAHLLPEDLSLQIASMTYTPRGAVMNIIGEFVLPKSDILDNDVLIFGAPRLCVQQDRLLPEDGVLALLSNFKIKDPDSGWNMTFKAPLEPLDPKDGCFLKWENDEFGGLGLEIAMTIPHLKRVIDGKVQDTPPILDLQATIKESWSDWMGRISMDPFQAEDLAGWTFAPGKDIIFDHSCKENYQGNGVHFPDISRMPSTYDPAQVNNECKSNWNAWQGIYVDEISVQFPKWAVFGKGKEGLKIAGQKMFFDNSGITCDIAALNLMEAETGEAGGWEFDLDMAKVMITQNNFDSCHIEGRFAIPLFGKKDNTDDSAKAKGQAGSSGKSGNPGQSGGSNKKSNPDQGKIRFACDIRHLTDSTTTYYTYDRKGNKVEHKKKTYGEDMRMAYYFKTQQIDSLDFSCFVADVNLIKEQTYFMVTAIDRDKDNTDTYVELNMGGQINIADSNSTINSIREYAKKLPLNMDFKGIHFAKMRLANFSYKDSAAVYKTINTYFGDSLGTKRLRSEQAWATAHSGRWVALENKEMELTSKCFFDAGEWSLSSPKKNLGAFSVELSDWSFGYENEKLTLGIEGTIGLCEDKVNTSVGIAITSKLTIPSDITNISGYQLSEGKVEFRSIKLDCDFTMLHLKGELNVADGTNDKGYAGSLDIDIKGLFSVNCTGGYFDHTTAKGEKAAADSGLTIPNSYAWGYFTVDISSGAGIHIDPVVINRIAGGFYFNSRPTQSSAATKAEARYGLIGVSMGLGLQSSAGKETLSADMDLNVVYDRHGNNGDGCLTTFLFKGNMKALSGLVEAKVQLLYQNDDKDRFLSLDITVEATSSNLSGKVGKFMEKANAELAKMQKTLDEFQENLESSVKDFVADIPMPGMDSFKSDYDSKSDSQRHSKEEKKISEEAKKKAEDNKPRAAEFKIPLQFKITWKENGAKKTPTRWHLYLGEPDEKKRCQLLLVDFKSSIVNVNIGANAYLCIGNELPGDGQLPPIPSVITQFLNGGSSQVGTNASLDKAQRSRSAAIKALLPTGNNVNGGVMVGASAWGFIDVDLGLFYGSLNAIAGFDMALVNYGNMAFCTNLGRAMGKNGWYAMGQFYAYLAAKFGLHIKLGKLIDRKIDIVDAGIGGVFECGMPSPTWIEGKARVKMKLLTGLVNIDRSFSFTCGERCEVFVGNALDGFNLFDYCNIASDSIGLGWSNAGEISVRDFNKAMFTTTAALGAQYRLVDPSDQLALSQQTGYDASTLNLNAARTYVFDLNNDISDSDSKTYGSIAAELYEFDFAKSGGGAWHNTVVNTIQNCGYQSITQTNWEMESKYYSNKKWKSNSDMVNPDAASWSKTQNLFHNQYRQYRIPIKIKEEARGPQGSRFHFTDVKLKPGCFYVLRLIGTAYEVEDGQQVWPTFVAKNKKGEMADYRIRWLQNKFFFFNTRGEEQIDEEPLGGLQQYVALAYPAAPDSKLFNNAEDKDEAYMHDIARPTIALNTDIEGKAYTKGKLTWQLRSRKVGNENWAKTEVQPNRFVRDGSSFVNMQPQYAFSPYKAKSADKNSDYEYNLQVLYTKQVAGAGVDCMAKLTAEENFSMLTDFMREHGMYDGYAAVAGGTPEETAATMGTQLAIVLLGLYGADQYGGDADAFQNALNTYYDQKGLACQKDTVIVLADMIFRGSDRPNWQTLSGPQTMERSRYNTRKKKYEILTTELTYSMGEPLPYERPFVGVCPVSSPLGSVFIYSLADEMAHMKSYDKPRLDNPYAYFAYLSNTVFIGGLKMSPYSFDDIEIRHATEPLTFSYNGFSVEGSRQIEGLSESSTTVAQKMYNTWNKWHYNDKTLPTYPLPWSDADITLPNQDGKTPPSVPAYDKTDEISAHHLCFAELVKDFAAPYYVAETLCNKMKDIADDVYGIYSSSWYNNSLNGDTLNNRMKQWNNRHRGQYLTVESRGFKVKVPYYQFPLIFGDCFGTFDGKNATDVTHSGQTLPRSSRSFKFSLKNLSGTRSYSSVSNLLFFRLYGGHAFHADKNWDYGESPNNNRRYVEQDVFRARNALNTVKNFESQTYRVNAYNLDTGEFYVKRFGADAVDLDDVYNAVDVDYLNVGGSSVKSMSDWVDKVGAPTVICNDEVLDNSFDKDNNE